MWWKLSNYWKAWKPEIRLEMSRLQSEIASLSVKEADLKTKIAELESKVDLIPQIEAESTALNRDYDILKKKYEELLARREAADLSRRAEVSAEELQFILGFGTGIGLAFLISQLSPVLVRPKQLLRLSDYPVWGTVSHLEFERINKKNNRRLLVFLASSGAIVMIYGVLIAAEIMNINIAERFF